MNTFDHTPADLEALRIRTDGRNDAAALATLAGARHALLNGGRLLVDWLGANRDGDRHKVTIRVAYIADDYAEGHRDREVPAGVPRVRVLDITKHMTTGRWMSAARGSEGFVAVFGGGGTSPATGTVEIVAHALGLDADGVLASFGGAR